MGTDTLGADTKRQRTLRLPIHARPRFAITPLTIALTLAVGLLAPGVAVARRIATGRTKTAIVRVVPVARPTPQRCLLVYVTTKDGSNWATMGFDLAKLHSCLKWAANGVAIDHRVNGRWRWVASGSAEMPCGRLGIPVAVREDLRLPCAVPSPPQKSGTLHLTQFLSPDHKVWCVIGLPSANCVSGYGFGKSNPPQSSGLLYPDGNVTLCHVAVPSFPNYCVQNWNSNAPVLRLGQQTELDGFLCTSGTTGITCTVAMGANKGKGFVITSTGVMQIGPSSKPATDYGRARLASSGRFPQMGCNARGADSAPAPIAAYAPSRCYLSAVGPGAPGYGDAVNLESIAHVRWSHWGARTATGRGEIVACGTGCTSSPARMTVSGLATNQLVGGQAYTRLRVTFTATYPTKHTATITYNVRPVPYHTF